jgi:hypothetical protein
MALTDNLLSARYLNAVAPASGYKYSSFPSPCNALNGATAFSVAIWAKWISGTNLIGLSAPATSSAKFFRLLKIEPSTIGVQWAWAVSGTHDLSYTNGALPLAVDGNYHLHTITYDGTSRKIYIDATLLITLVLAGGVQTNEVSPGEGIAGTSGIEVPSIAIWNRAITLAEITEVVAAGVSMSALASSTAATPRVLSPYLIGDAG